MTPDQIMEARALLDRRAMLVDLSAFLQRRDAQIRVDTGDAAWSVVTGAKHGSIWIQLLDQPRLRTIIEGEIARQLEPIEKQLREMGLTL